MLYSTYKVFDGRKGYMSLTSFLKQSKETREAMKVSFPCSLRSISLPPLRAAPLTTNYAMVGQAFDYLLRFYMQRNNPYAPKKSPWVANFIKLPLASHDEESEQQRARRTVEESARPLLEDAHMHHERYLEDGK